ncbi:DUF3768 domain-containing protein [Planktomarina temperata]|nr:DUF3768 domain-containing protein [Planktomarina temperata]
MGQSEHDRIRDQNDKFRTGDPGIPGQRVMTQGINALLDGDQDMQLELLQFVAAFDDFSPDNDPQGHHDFGIFDFHGHRCNWKIDLYDKDYEYGSNAPDDLTQTNRVLTILLASEY